MDENMMTNEMEPMENIEVEETQEGSSGLAYMVLGGLITGAAVLTVSGIKKAYKWAKKKREEKKTKEDVVSEYDWSPVESGEKSE